MTFVDNNQSERMACIPFQPARRDHRLNAGDNDFAFLQQRVWRDDTLTLLDARSIAEFVADMRGHLVNQLDTMSQDEHSAGPLASDLRDAYALAKPGRKHCDC